MRKSRNPQIIAGRVNADGSIAVGEGFTVNKTGVGAYTITVPFRVIGIVLNQGTGAVGPVAGWVDGITERSFSCVLYNTAGSARQDNTFSFICTGPQQ